jgi:hypothetical protein
MQIIGCKKNTIMYNYTGLLFLKFEKKDWIILSLLALVLMFAELAFFDIIGINSQKTNVFISVICGFLPWWIMDVRFGNLLFSIFWAILIIQYFYVVHLYRFTIFPLVGFFSFHFIRLIFWFSYSREFIPTLFGQTNYRARYSKILNRRTTGEDAVYSILLIVVIFISFSFFIEY